jgi:preprotein translocase subunit SecE
MNEKVADAPTGSTVSRGLGYFAESYEELKKVHTPTRQETVRLTWVVLLIIMFISLCLFVIDLTFNWLMSKMIA